MRSLSFCEFRSALTVVRPLSLFVLNRRRFQLVTTTMNVTPIPATENNIAHAARALVAGELVAFPTETVYGLGADATNAHAVASIFAAKGRPTFNPLIIHLPSAEAAWQWGACTPAAERLAAAFWPGGLTLVLEKTAHREPRLCDLVSAGLSTVAIRVPAHRIAH